MQIFICERRNTNVFLRPATFLDLAEWLKRLTVNAKVATVLGTILASSDTVEYEGWQPADETLLNTVHKK